MTPEQVKKLRAKSKEDLIKIIVNLDKKLFHIIKEQFQETKDGKNLFDFI